MLPRETMTSGAPTPEPCDCCGDTTNPLQVLKTWAYYVGTACGGCGLPNSRETDYFKRRPDAEAALKRMQAADLSDTRAAKAGMLPGVRSDAGGDA